MIHKVERIVSIGKYRNYQAVGQVNFKKMTLIYGDNGGGKTTLTSVFRSLTTNNPEVIRSRISTNHISPQAAQITQIGTPQVFHTFGAAGWTVPFPNIEIFDIHFVNENIYSGFDFNEEHKKQLHQFVIGAHGITIQNQIEQNKNDKVNSKQNIGVVEQQLIQNVGNNLSTDLIPTFLKISPTLSNGIDQLIINAETALTNANSNAVIQSLQPLIQASIISSTIKFTEIITDLRVTSQAIQNSILQTLFSNHCHDLSQHSIDSPENWLQQGFAYIESKQDELTSEISCPFCQQNILSNNEIINAYISKFNVEFNSLLERLQAHLISLQNFNIEAEILTINNINQTNGGRITSWSVHLPSTVQTPVFNIISDENLFKTEFQNLIVSVKQKLQNPTVAVAVAAATVFQDKISSINNSIGIYNQNVKIYNNSITNFRSSIQSISSAQLEVEKLRRIKKRFEAPIVTLCTQLSAEKLALKGLETAYTTLSQQQQLAANTFFTNYQTRINYYLVTVFKTLFRIDNVTHVAPQGKATQSKLGYKLTIDNKDISFSPNQPFSAKECLSEGDKSTIALAFFLSKLDIDPNRHDKILVFDDPLSSLDTNRRTYTIGIIKDLFTHMKQVVVLSHNEFFLHEIGKDFGAAVKNTLRITENFAAKASSIEVCDLDELVKNDYFKHIEALEAFRITPNHVIKDTVLGWLRNVLESHLRFKFYKEIRPMTGMQTFGRLISFLDNSGTAFKDNSNRPTIIANLNLINSVSWKPHHGTPMPNYASMGINPNSITASELDNLIQDTLNLIEIQL